MSDTDDIERIRAEKRESLERDLQDGAATAPDDPIHVDGPAHLADLTAEYGVVLVDFYADWCGPCQMLEPIVESLAASTPAAVAKVDVDANQGLASEYGVRGVPTLLLFADGDTVERVVGVQSEDQLSALIDQYA
ncbi:thioredoxin [Haloplanus rubicundus]|uniref:Thioredoxin n=1 Tax=Haloplanus rubicundus TaxID=1547898 RepID=A0A345EE60_9EURY|nr:thioredoxin [Haloplanus rubicundus]AXG10482.1 thioredoxin [Haloplanus rubicundus]